MKGVAELLLKIKTKGAGALDALKSKFAVVVASIAAVGAAITKLSLDASKFNEVETAFTNLAKSQGQDAQAMLDNMKKLSAGTISDLELMQQANQALLLGLPVEKFGDMLQIARSSAKATGQSMEFMLQSIVTGLGRGSKLMLDNLGIMIDTNKSYEKYAATLGKTADKLTDAEKKQAFINEALRIGKENAEAAGGGAESAADKWAQMKASLENIAISIGQVFLPAFTKALDIVNSTVSAVEKMVKGDDALTTAKKELTAARLAEYNAQVRLDALLKGSNVFEQNRAKAALDASKQIVAQKKLEFETIRSQTAQELADAKAAKAAKDALMADELAKKKELEEQKAEVSLNAKEAEKELDVINKEEKMLAEQAFTQALQDQEFAQKMEHYNKLIAAETDHAKQKELIRQKDALKTKKVDKETKKLLGKERDKKAASDMQINATVAGHAADLSNSLVTLTQGNNKTLLALAKAAAIAQIILNTQAGAMRATIDPGGIPGQIMSGLIYAQGAVALAIASGVRLADGGIVTARPGGMPAVIGEGGRDEAVIPLEDGMPEGGMGTTVNITVMGGLLGDENSAREFALAVDNELLKLRRNNESVAFETGVV